MMLQCVVILTDNKRKITLYDLAKTSSRYRLLISRFSISWNALNYAKGQRSSFVNKQNSC